MENQRDLPRAIIYSTLVAAVFFALVSIVAVGVLPVIRQLVSRCLKPARFCRLRYMWLL